MKVIQSASADQNSRKQPADTVNSRNKSILRTGSYMTGAFLFVAFVAGSVYASSPDNNNTATNSQSESTSIKAEPIQEDESMNQQPEAQSDSTSEGMSTSVTSVNGKTEVKVNGQTVVPATDGSVNKTITTDNGSVNINVNQSTTNSGDGFSSSFSSSSSSSFSSSNGSNVHSEFNMNTGN